MDAERVFLAHCRRTDDPTVRNIDRNQSEACDQGPIGASMNLTSLDQITPVVLTHDEEANLRRNLDSLPWAQRVVIVDSGSADATEAIARSYANVTWHTRPFDSFRAQWEHAIHQTGVTTEYVLALDCDMEVSANLLEEITGGFLKGNYDGGLMPIDYRYYGRSLAGSICPPPVRLF